MAGVTSCENPPYVILAIEGAHNSEQATSMRLCHGVFKDQFIFRTVLAQILNIF